MIISAMITALESKWRQAVPTIPAGTLGVERGWRPTHEIAPGSFPHVMMFDATETSELLIFRQAKVQADINGLYFRQDATNQEIMDDFEMFVALIEADPSLGAILDYGFTGSDGMEWMEGGTTGAVAWRFSGFKVLP